VTVEIDTVKDGAGGVYIGWRHSGQFRRAAQAEFEQQRYGAPAMLFSGAVSDAMCEAIGTVLQAAGFAVTDADDLRPFDLKVSGFGGHASRPVPYGCFEFEVEATGSGGFASTWTPGAATRCLMVHG
jgi:hypothetical protein